MRSPRNYKKTTAFNAIARDVAMQSYGQLKEVLTKKTSQTVHLEITSGRVKKKILIPPAAIDVLLNFLKAYRNFFFGYAQSNLTRSVTNLHIE